MRTALLKPNPLKISILGLLFVFAWLTSCKSDDTQPKGEQIVITDENFEAALIYQGIDSDGEINGLISQADAETATRLDLNINSNHGDIENLSGIEAFANITYLSAYGQKLESVDLSKNTKLETLILYNNYLTEIDLSSNTRLISVDVHYNELNTITGLQDLASLKIIDISYNNLESVSISNMTVETIYLMQNQLNSVDVSESTSLKTLLITSNQLEEIDLSSNTLLEALILSDNQIQEVDLEQNSRLSYLYISSNSLTSLDVSHNLALVDLKVDRNPDLDCIKIADGQTIPTSSLSDHQQLSTSCH